MNQSPKQHIRCKTIHIGHQLVAPNVSKQLDRSQVLPTFLLNTKLSSGSRNLSPVIICLLYSNALRCNGKVHLFAWNHCKIYFSWYFRLLAIVLSLSSLEEVAGTGFVWRNDLSSFSQIWWKTEPRMGSPPNDLFHKTLLPPNIERLSGKYWHNIVKNCKYRTNIDQYWQILPILTNIVQSLCKCLLWRRGFANPCGIFHLALEI